MLSQEAAAVGADELLRKHGIHHGKLNFPRRGEWKVMRDVSLTVTPSPSPSPVKRRFSPRQVITIPDDPPTPPPQKRPKSEAQESKSAPNGIKHSPTFTNDVNNMIPPRLELSASLKGASRPEILRLCDKNRQLKEVRSC